MASTNKTSNYELSQFVGTDKPGWLTDYNADMGKIDTAIKNNADAIASAGSGGTEALQKIGTLSNLNTTVKTDLVNAINEVNTATGTAQNTANSASNTANQAQAGVNANKASIDAILAQFALTTTQFNSTTPNNRSITGGSFSDGSIGVAVNSDSTLLKMYADCFIQNVVSGTEVHITLPVPGLTVEEDYTINPAGFVVYGTGSNLVDLRPARVEVKNNAIHIKFTTSTSGTHRIELYPCLYINKNFGDTIITE